MADELTLAERLAAERARIFELEVQSAKLAIELELTQAQERAALAEHRANRAERRIEELETALGRRRRAAFDRQHGVERLRLP